MFIVVPVVFILGVGFFLFYLWEWSFYGCESMSSQPVASTVSPKRRRGVISFLVHRQV